MSIITKDLNSFFKETSNTATAAELGSIAPKVMAAFGRALSDEVRVFCAYLDSVKSGLNCLQWFKKVNILYQEGPKVSQIFFSTHPDGIIGTAHMGLGEQTANLGEQLLEVVYTTLKTVRFVDTWKLIQPLAGATVKKIIHYEDLIDFTTSVKGIATEVYKLSHGSEGTLLFEKAGQRFKPESVNNSQCRNLSRMTLISQIAICLLSSMGLAASAGVVFPYAATVELICLVALPLLKIGNFIWLQHYAVLPPPLPTENVVGWGVEKEVVVN